LAIPTFEPEGLVKNQRHTVASFTDNSRAGDFREFRALGVRIEGGDKLEIRWHADCRILPTEDSIAD
jgi:hypothetical protein